MAAVGAHCRDAWAGPKAGRGGSQSKVARGSLVEGALIWNMQEAGTSFPLGLAPTTPSARDQAGVTVPLQSHSHCLPALRCAARYRRLRAPGPTTLSPQPHAVSFAPPPLSTLGGLFFSPLLTLSPLNPFQPGLQLPGALACSNHLQDLAGLPKVLGSDTQIQFPFTSLCCSLFCTLICSIPKHTRPG